jgi:hypothetical protein
VFGLLVVAHAANAGPIFMGHEYEVVLAEGITWVPARAAAMALPGGGWDLASISSGAENAFVEGLLTALLPLPSRSHFWIGGTDSEAQGTTEGVWIWSDGTPFSFTDWWPGEPNNVTTFDPPGEDYLAYDLRSGLWAWNDGGDSVGTVYGFSRGFVAERVAAVPEPATLTLVGLGVLGATLGRRRRTS